MTSRRESGEVTVCAGRVRERPVFLSDTERVEVTIMTASPTDNDEPAYFILRYSGMSATLSVLCFSCHVSLTTPAGGW